MDASGFIIRLYAGHGISGKGLGILASSCNLQDVCANLSV